LNSGAVPQRFEPDPFDYVYPAEESIKAKIFGPWLLILCFQAFAEDTLGTIDVIEFDTPFLKYTGAPAWSASEQEMLESTQVQEVINQVPGVYFTQNGGYGGRGALFLRGSESRHNAFLIDGLKINDPSNTDRHFDTAFLLTPFFKDMVVSLGPSPVLYGGDAISGVIELVPRRGSESQETILGLSYGSFESRQIMGMKDWGKGDHQGTMGLVHFKTEGFSRLSKKRFNATENDGAENNQLFQASRHRWTSSLSTDVYLQGTSGLAEQDGFGVDEKESRTKNQVGYFSQTTRYQKESAQFWLKTGLNSSQRDILSESVGKEIYQGQLRSFQLGSKIEHDKNQTILGVNFEQEWIGLENLAAQNDSLSVFVLEQIHFHDFIFELGGRSEEHQRYGNFFSYEATTRWQLSSKLMIHGKLAQGYKNPSLYQLFGPDLFGFPVGNPDLVPETNKSYELGVHWNSTYSGSVVAFQQDFQNLLIYTNDGYLNQGSLRVQGIESQITTPEFRFGQFALSHTLHDFSNFSQTPLRRPPFALGLNWKIDVNQFVFEVNGQFVGGRRDINFDGDTVKLVGYETLSAVVRYNYNESQQWILRLGNMTNREYEEIWGYSVAPVNANLQWIGRF
jgi:vitamin B12 transporter